MSRAHLRPCGCGGMREAGKVASTLTHTVRVCTDQACTGMDTSAPPLHATNMEPCSAGPRAVTACNLLPMRHLPSPCICPVLMCMHAHA